MHALIYDPRKVGTSNPDARQLEEFFFLNLIILKYS